MLGERARAAECDRKVASVSRPSRSGTRKGSRAVPGAPFQGLLMMETLSLLGGCRREVKKAGEKGIALSWFGNRENFHSTTFRESIGQIIMIPFPNLWRKFAKPNTRLRVVFGRA